MFRLRLQECNHSQHNDVFRPNELHKHHKLSCCEIHFFRGNSKLDFPPTFRRHKVWVLWTLKSPARASYSKCKIDMRHIVAVIFFLMLKTDGDPAIFTDNHINSFWRRRRESDSQCRVFARRSCLANSSRHQSVCVSVINWRKRWDSNPRTRLL